MLKTVAVAIRTTLRVEKRENSTMYSWRGFNIKPSKARTGGSLVSSFVVSNFIQIIFQ